jgi:uncharacterized membrane protein
MKFIPKNSKMGQVNIYWLLVVSGVVLYTVFFTLVSFLRYDAFSFTDFDFSIFVHEYWKLAHGSPNISLFMNVPLWGNALEVFSFLVTPFFVLFRFHPQSLLFLQALILALGALPVFLIARHKKLPDVTAMFFAFSYLFNPSIWYTNLYEFNALVFTTTWFLLAFYFFQTNRFKWFLVFIVLCIINRLDVGIITGMFGVYAFVERRSWKWVLTPIFLSVLWIGIGLFVIIPKFRGPLLYDVSYPQFGSSFSEILRNIVFHPEILWKSLVGPINGKYAYDVLMPVVFLSVFGIKEFLICLPSLLQHLISMRPSEHTIFFHYTATITPFIYISAIYGAAQLLQRYKSLVRFSFLIALFSLSGNFVYGPLSTIDQYRAMTVKDNLDEYKHVLLKEIPPDAPVISSFEFSPMLAGRYYYYSFHYVAAGFFRTGFRYPTPDNIAYALIDFEDSRLLNFYHYNSDVLMKIFFENFGIVDMAESVVLFKKGYVSDLKLYEVKPEPPKEDGVLQTAAGLRLTKVDVHRAARQERSFLDFALHWTLLKPIPETAGFVLSIVDAQGRQIYSSYRLICYGVYPTRRWTTQQEVIDYHQLLLPKSLKAGEYRVFLSIFSENENRYYKLFKIDMNNLVPLTQPNIMISTFNIP